MSFQPIAYNIDMMAVELTDYNSENPTAIQLNPGEENDLMLAMIAGASDEFNEFMVLGKEGIRSDTPLMKNLGIMRDSCSPLQIDKKITDTYKGMFPSATTPLVQHYVKTLSTQGAIMNTSRWHILKNDCFIYGALQSQKTFHLALQTLTVKDLWNDSENRPTVLGRELYMLKLSGYKAHQTHLEMLFSPPEPNSPNPEPASLSRYRKCIDSITKVNDILDNFLYTISQQ